MIAPPRPRTLSLDCCFDQGTGWQEIPFAQAFEGEYLRFTATGAGARIDAATGRLLIPTGRPHDGEDIRVEAHNAAGSAEMVFQVAVEDDGMRAPLRAGRDVEFEGVRFRFGRPVEYGHFISGGNGAGDPFVIGPVTLESYSPRSGKRARDKRVMNGAMLNPRCSVNLGFDSLTVQDVYRSSLNVGLELPLRLEPGDSLIVSTSNPKAEHPRETSAQFIVITCLAEAPFEDSFRPPYSGPARPIHRLSDIRTDRLLTLPGVGRRLGAADREEYESRFKRFSVEISPNWNREHLASGRHQPLYGRDICQNEAEPFLWVHGNYPVEDKVEVLIGLLQNGIDRYGTFQSAKEQGFHPWLSDGAHHSGRKFSILHAGHLFDDPGMLSITQQSRELGGTFQEDAMTFYVTPELVAFSQSDKWKPPYGNSRPTQPFETSMIGIPDWRGKESKGQVNAAWTGHPYRVSGNHNTQHAQVLLTLALGLREAWDHEPYFDYHMRFCEIMANRPDPWRFQGKRQALFNPIEGTRPKNGWADWERRWRSELAWKMLMKHQRTYYRWPWQT